MENRELVLCFRDNMYSDNDGQGYGTLCVRFGEIDAEGKYDSVCYGHPGAREIKISCQWHNERAEKCDWQKPFTPYGFRIRAEDVDMSSIEAHAKMFRQVKNYLAKQPGTNDFGMWVFMICNALKITRWVNNPEWREVTQTREIKDIAGHLNWKIQERERRIAKEAQESKDAKTA